MKRYKVFVFVLAAVAVFLLVWLLCPVTELGIFRLPSKSAWDRLHKKDTVAVAQDTVVVAEVEDTLPKTCIYLPYKQYFDGLFADMTNAAESGRTVRIMHYGDSQIEADRVSSTLRERLQERFGGYGPGMFPAFQGEGTHALIHYCTGSFSSFTMYGDDGSRTSTHRYGPLCRMGLLGGSGSLLFRQSKSKHAREGVKRFSRVGLLVGNTGRNFKATLYADTAKMETFVLDSAKAGVSYLVWEVPQEYPGGKVVMSGKAEVYGMSVDGQGGVAVDNGGLRSCSGYIFTQIDSTVLRQSFELTDTRLILMEFGLNVIKGIYSTENVIKHVRQTEQQVRHFKSTAPGACIMVIGPNDLDVRRGGMLMSYPWLSEYNDSLKAMSLRNEVAFFDLFEFMGGESSGLAWNRHTPQLMGPDYTHFTQQGADSVGFALADELLKIYQARTK